VLNRQREHPCGRADLSAKPVGRLRLVQAVALAGLLPAISLTNIACHRTCTGRTAGFTPQPGDLLFQDLDAGPLCDAIEQVTLGHDGANLSHVGLVARDARRAGVVIEAVSAGVVVTPLEVFLARSLDPQGRPKVLAGRLNPAVVANGRRLALRAVEHARTLEGARYDRHFLVDNDSYYCSELIYEVFRRANEGRPLFDLRPMTFREPGSEEPLAAWTVYFAGLGVAIPEGCPGINPGGISRSPVLTIVHEYGAVTRKPASCGSDPMVRQQQ